MAEFDINLPPARPPLPEEVEAVKQEAHSLAQTIVSTKGDGSLLNPPLGRVLEDLQSGRYWGVFAEIDGFTNRWPFHDGPTLAKRDEIRQWARGTFTHDELQAILNTCVRTALIAPYHRSGRPADHEGHHVLHELFYEMKDSMFYSAVNLEVKLRLDNGRFWEMLANTNSGGAVRILNEVLTDRHQCLQPQFAPYGYSIFARNDGERCFDSLKGLTPDAKANYIDFVGKLASDNGDGGLSNEQIAVLVQPLRNHKKAV